MVRDCDFEKGEISVLGDPATGTKNWELRRVPMIPICAGCCVGCKRIVVRKEFSSKSVMLVHECQEVPLIRPVKNFRYRPSYLRITICATCSPLVALNPALTAYTDGQSLARPQGWRRAGDESLWSICATVILLKWRRKFAFAKVNRPRMK